MRTQPHPTVLLLLGLFLPGSAMFPSGLPPTLPSWAPTYDMQMSSLTMQCNSSGWSSPTRGGSFGIVSYDWSNAKAQWAAAKPMDCEERLLTQAQMTKKANPKTHAWGESCVLSSS